jgi:hypothetical protein
MSQHFGGTLKPSHSASTWTNSISWSWRQYCPLQHWKIYNNYMVHKLKHDQIWHLQTSLISMKQHFFSGLYKMSYVTLCSEITVITGGRVFQIAHGTVFILSSIKNYMFKYCNRRWINPVRVQTRAKFTKPKPTWCKAITKYKPKIGIRKSHP